MIHPPQPRVKDLSAFCAVCPPADVVTALLEDLGFSLIFSMKARRYLNVAPLPAQYHYRDGHGTEVVFLAGRDTPDGVGNKYPNHASRWWLYAGSSPYTFNLVAQTLSAQFSIQWPMSVTQGS